MKKFILVLFILLVFRIDAHAQSVQYQAQVIAQVISAEASGEGYLGMYLVSNTIKNRALLYHKTPYQIVIQKNQYYGLTAKNKNKLYNQVKKQADYLACNLMNLPDKTSGALYFRQLKEPRLKYHKTETIRYNHHIFYK
jgi:spore germination cell wall hydrolase CwlJ-like protein